MLSFQTSENGETIRIYCDLDGVARLRQSLANLLEYGDHVHIFSGDLSQTTPLGDNAASEVILYLETPE